ncbi:histone-lysine N-methyltransferase SETMAR [Trichonephila clavipes]|nr:histone-lysine N-methyltransferase SETMAR [Trichonephila clavipes]
MYGFPMFSQRQSLLKRHENYPFLKRIITGDEKWVVYNNVKRTRSWSKKDEPAQTISKADIHQKKAVTPKCLGGPPVDCDRRNAHPGLKE